MINKTIISYFEGSKFSTCTFIHGSLSMFQQVSQSEVELVIFTFSQVLEVSMLKLKEISSSFMTNFSYFNSRNFYFSYCNIGTQKRKISL